MGQNSLLLALSAGVCLGSASARPFAADDETGPVVVLVDNRASAAPEVLDHAGKEVARIYRQAALRIVWLTAADGDRGAAGRFTVHLKVRSGLLPKPNESSRFVMGAAPGGAIACGGLTLLFFDQVIEFSRVQQLPAALVMGTVIAHEIGHVLLRNRGHSSEGLMRAAWRADDWQRAATGILLFSSSEARAMRDTLASCR